MTKSPHSRQPPLDAGDGVRLCQAYLTAEDFQRARRLAPALASFESYDEWLDEREGSIIGLAHAEIEVVSVHTPLARFVEWARLNHVDLGLNALDAFAEQIDSFRNAPQLACLAELSEDDFTRFGPRLAATEKFAGLAQWTLHRKRKRDAVTGAAYQVAVDAGAFLQWARCLSLPTTESNLDAYARLLLEHLAWSDQAELY